MSTRTIDPARVQPLNKADTEHRDYVLYWMQQSQRAEHNDALEYAVRLANDLDQPLLVGFGLTADYPEANRRHYHFMLQGLQETRKHLQSRGIKMVVRRGSPEDVALELGRRASAIVCDRGYLMHQRNWRRKVAGSATVKVVQVEADVAVPVETVSGKAEYAARTIRPRINKHKDRFLKELQTTPLKNSSLPLSVEGMDFSDTARVLDSLHLPQQVSEVNLFQGGTAAAKRVLQEFIRHKFARYSEHRNQPQTDDVSHMSKYLHFGQISPVYVALQVSRAADVVQEERDAYLEELLVRRELTVNFVYYTTGYDTYSCLPAWAQDTLRDHRNDARPEHYTKDEMEAAETHDPYWNAAMREMRCTGYMHNYMRMYWGKKILQWCNTPEYAFQVALELNNKYFIDGRDPASFANIAWIFGQHDRPWKEREIFGKVRYMSAAGLERKADPKAYVQKVDALCAR